MKQLNNKYIQLAIAFWIGVFVGSILIYISVENAKRTTDVVFDQVKKEVGRECDFVSIENKSANDNKYTYTFKCNYL